MDGYALAATIIQAFVSLAWPATICFAVWLFRSEIKPIFARLEIQHGDMRISVKDTIERIQTHEARVNVELQPKLDTPVLETHRLTELSSDELRSEVRKISLELRELDHKFMKERRNNNFFESSWKTQIDSSLELSDQQRLEWITGLRPRALSLLNELTSRADVKIENERLYPRMVIERGVLAGPDPLTEAADYLEALARRIPA
jgi:hypothetical protein